MDYIELNHDNYKDFKSIKNCVYRFISPSEKSYIGITKNFYNRYVGIKEKLQEKRKIVERNFMMLVVNIVFMILKFLY